MSLIDIRMDHSSITIDGYDVGLRVPPKSRRVCSVVVWDKVREVLDGFDIDEPAEMKEEIILMTDTLKLLNEENDRLHEIIRSGKLSGEIK